MARKASPLVACGLLLLVLAGGIYMVREYIQLSRPLPADARVITRTVYTLDHQEVDGSAILLHRQGCSALDLLRLYPATQGWTLSFSGNDVILTHTVPGLSPDDMKKTHLGAKGGFVAVVRGPAGVDGGIIRVTIIRVSSLPPDYQQQALQGTLDLPDEVTLMQVMDSLNENSQGG